MVRAQAFSAVLFAMVSIQFTMDAQARADTIYYVEPAPGGSNGYNGLTEDTAFATIQHAINQCTNNGTYYTIYVMGGTTHFPTQYSNGVTYFLLWNQKRITIAPTPGTGTPVLDGQGLHPRNSTGTSPTTRMGLIQIDDCQEITIRGLKIFRSGQTGIYVRETRDSASESARTKNVVIEDCVVDDTWAGGIDVEGKKTNQVTPTVLQPKNIIIRNNTITNACRANSATNGISNPAGEAIRIFNTDTFDVYGNTIYNYYKEGIDVNYESQNGEIYNNEVGPRNSDSAYGEQTGAGIYVEGASGVTPVQNIDIYNNVVIGDGSDEGCGIVIGSEGGGDVDDVLIFNNVVAFMSAQCISLSGDTNNGTNSGDHTNIKIYHNTFVGDDNGFAVARIANNDLSYAKLAGFEFKNNIVCRLADSSSLFVNSLTGTPLNFTIDNNLYWDGGGPVTGALGTNTVQGDPEFEFKSWSWWPFSSSYYINWDDSAARDAGVTISVVSDDIAGEARPDGAAPDIGAFESQH